MFTYAQFLRLLDISREAYMIVESVPFMDRLPYTLMSCLMVVFVILFVCTAVTGYKRLMVAQRQNRRLRQDIEFWRDIPAPMPAPMPDIRVPLAILVPGAAQDEDWYIGQQIQAEEHGHIGQEIERRTLQKALENMQKLTQSLKHDSELLNTMEAKHKGQLKKSNAQDAAAIKLLEDRHKMSVSANTKEHKAETAALGTRHALEHPDPTAEQLKAQTVELHNMHMTNSNADGLAQGTFDTEMLDLHVAHKEEASQLVDRQRSEKRAFEDKCLHEHSRNMRACY